MKKSTIDRLKAKNAGVPKLWTKQEVRDLKELKDAGIMPSVIVNDEETMNELFPGRSKIGVAGKYDKI